jgi:hypothetical protein
MVELRKIVRAPEAILSIAALVWGSLQAPFFHIHASELDHAAASIPAHLHIHLAPRAPGHAITYQTADDDAVETEWSVAQPQPITILAVITVPGKIRVPSPVFSSVVLDVPLQRAHDPPDAASKQPRSPPA